MEGRHAASGSGRTSLEQAPLLSRPCGACEALRRHTTFCGRYRPMSAGPSSTRPAGVPGPVLVGVADICEAAWRKRFFFARGAPWLLWLPERVCVATSEVPVLRWALPSTRRVCLVESRLSRASRGGRGVTGDCIWPMTSPAGLFWGGSRSLTGRGGYVGRCPSARRGDVIVADLGLMGAGRSVALAVRRPAEAVLRSRPATFPWRNERRGRRSRSCAGSGDGASTARDRRGPASAAEGQRYRVRSDVPPSSIRLPRGGRRGAASAAKRRKPGAVRRGAPRWPGPEPAPRDRDPAAATWSPTDVLYLCAGALARWVVSRSKKRSDLPRLNQIRSKRLTSVEATARGPARRLGVAW